jgi:hypothetical protein
MYSNGFKIIYISGYVQYKEYYYLYSDWSLFRIMNIKKHDFAINLLRINSSLPLFPTLCSLSFSLYSFIALGS